MNQLIKITTVPIQYELKINNARLEYSRSKAELEISRSKEFSSSYDSQKCCPDRSKRQGRRLQRNRAAGSGRAAPFESGHRRGRDRTDHAAENRSANRRVPAWFYTIRSGGYQL